MNSQVQFYGKKFLITGASGFIGSHLCHRLNEAGAEIHAISRQNRQDTESKLHWWQGDLTDIKSVRQILRTVEPDLILHLAGYVKGSHDIENVLPSFQNNLVSQVNLMTIASEVGCDRFISTGSMEEPVDMVISQAVPNSPYVAAKLAARICGQMFSTLYQLPIIMPRVFMVYGPAQHDLSKLIPYVITSVLAGKPPKLTSGKRKIDWIYIDDVVDAILAIIQTPSIEDLSMDIGSGQLVSIQSTVDLLVNLLDPSIKPQFGALSDRPMEKEPVANTDDTHRLIGWSSKVPLEDGLRITVNWYKENLYKMVS
jgi:UDP-glucose 4-epimerase